jgi:hypothetical protein
MLKPVIIHVYTKYKSKLIVFTFISRKPSHIFPTGHYNGSTEKIRPITFLFIRAFEKKNVHHNKTTCHALNQFPVIKVKNTIRFWKSILEGMFWWRLLSWNVFALVFCCFLINQYVFQFTLEFVSIFTIKSHFNEIIFFMKRFLLLLLTSLSPYSRTSTQCINWREKRSRACFIFILKFINKFW